MQNIKSLRTKARNKLNFELGKEYIVKVSEKGIVPIDEFDRSRWYDKDFDDLDFLTDEEKIVVINDVLDKIRADIDEAYDIAYPYNISHAEGLEMALEIINKYKTESEEKYG